MVGNPSFSTIQMKREGMRERKKLKKPRPKKSSLSISVPTKEWSRGTVGILVNCFDALRRNQAPLMIEPLRK